MLNKLDDFLKKAMTQKKTTLILQLFSLSLSIIGIILCVSWYDFKLFIIIFILMFANNVDNNVKRLMRNEK